MEIAEELKLIPEKKENRRKALEDLQSFSTVLSSFTLQWTEIEDHLAAVDLDIAQRLKDLQSMEAARTPVPSAAAPTTIGSTMDADALRELIAEKRKRPMLRKAQITAALQSAPDPAALVLDAVIGPNPGNYGTCVGLGKASVAFVCLQEIEHDPTLPVKERAKQLADVLWSFESDTAAVLFLINLIGAYKILDMFPLESILDRITLFPKLTKHTVEACKSIGIRDHIPDLVEKLISKGKQFLALKFIDIFGLPEKYSPTPLLEACIEECRKAAEVMRKEGEKNKAKAKELCALKLVIEYIVKYNLCTEWKQKLERTVAHLEQSKERTTVSAPSKPKDEKQGQQKKLNKHPQLAGSSPSLLAVHAQPSILQTQPHLGLSGHPT